MSLKLTLAAAGLAALLAPMAASAQSWVGDQYRDGHGGQSGFAAPTAQGDRQGYPDRGQPDQRGGDRSRDGYDSRPGFVAPTRQDDWQGYDPYRGRPDWRDHDRRGGHVPSWFQGFPEFAGARDQLKREIWQGRREGWLSEDRAQVFVERYRDLERDEFRAFREHGWRLPDGERYWFRQRLADLDQRLDQARDRRY